MKTIRYPAISTPTYPDSARNRNHSSTSTKNHPETRSGYHPNLKSYSANERPRPNSNSWFTNIVLLLWLVTSVFVIFALTKIDSIVNQQLYNFGLQFSYEWANPYWAFLRTIFICIALPAVATAGLLLLDVWRRVAQRKHKSLQTTNRPVPITCPSCKKRFSKTMTMYDYSKGKAELIKICPYCNKVLSNEPIKPNMDVVKRRNHEQRKFVSA